MKQKKSKQKRKRWKKQRKRKKTDELKKVQELKKMEKKKDSGMNKIVAKELDVEYDAAAKLVSEGSKRLSVALSKKDMDEVTIPTALIACQRKEN